MAVIIGFHFAIGEPYVIKLNPARAFSLLRQSRRSDFNRSIQQFKNALAGCHGALKNVVLVAQVLDRAEETLRVLHERSEHADGDSAAEDAESAKINHHGNGHAGKDFHHRIVERVSHDGVFIRVHVLGVDAVKAAVGAPFTIEKLQHHHAGDVLLQIGVDAGDGGANAAVRVAHGLAENHRRPEDERQHGKGYEREPPVHPQHDDHDSGEHEDIFKDRHHAGGKHFIQRVHICSDARYKAANRIPVIEPDVHVLQVAEDLAAEIKHDFLPSPQHEIGLRVFQAKADQQQREVGKSQLGDANQRNGAEKTIENTVMCGRGKVFVDGGLGEERPQHVRASLKNDRYKRNHDLPFIGTQVPEQPLHQAAVIRFT